MIFSRQKSALFSGHLKYRHPVLKNSIRKNLLTGQTDLVRPVYWNRNGLMLTDTDQKNIELRLESVYSLTSEK